LWLGVCNRRGLRIRRRCPLGVRGRVADPRCPAIGASSRAWLLGRDFRSRLGQAAKAAVCPRSQHLCFAPASCTGADTLSAQPTDRHYSSPVIFAPLPRDRAVDMHPLDPGRKLSPAAVSCRNTELSRRRPMHSHPSSQRAPRPRQDPRCDAKTRATISCLL
jgi:hypothetical protein